MGRWLENYSGALAAGASIVLVVVTAIYVRLTSNMSKDSREQVRELRKTRLDAQMPIVAIWAAARIGGGDSRVVIDVDIQNIGTINPADVAVLDPMDWKSVSSGAADSEPGGVYFTVNPGNRIKCSLTTEIDPSRANSFGIETFGVEFEVSQQGAGATDYFNWTAFYNHQSGVLVDSRKTALHERRKYSSLDVDDLLEELPDKASKRRWYRLFMRS